MKNEAPILILAFRRPDKLERLLDKVTQQTNRQIYVFCDGPRNEDDKPLCLQTQQVAQRYNVKTTIRQGNLGITQNLFAALKEVLQRHSNVIIFEDDVHPKTGCIAFLDQALETYADRNDIFSIGCYHRQLPSTVYDDNVILSPRFNCWGWAIWANRWHRIQSALETDVIPYRYYDEVPENAGIDIPNRMRYHHLKKRELTWDTRVALYCLSNRWWQLQPKDVLIENIGFDGTGEHCGSGGCGLETFHGCYDPDTYRHLNPNLQPNLKVIRAVQASYEDQTISRFRRWRRKWFYRLNRAFTSLSRLKNP